MMKDSVLVTGFEPFDGRSCNASWIAARSLALTPGVRVLCLPVIWGAPLDALHAICSEDCPTTIVSMGEGRPGWFDIETVARNIRADRADNAGTVTREPIIRGGPERRSATIDTQSLKGSLAARGHPTRTSTDAGGFLCEETLYSLERLRELHSKLQRVAFCHLPPADSTCTEDGALERCTEDAVRSFAHDLVDVALQL